MKKKKKFNHLNSSTIFNKNDFFVGMGSVLSIGGNYFNYKYCDSNQDADNLAIGNDLKIVADDFQDVFNDMIDDYTIKVSKKLT